MEKSFFNSPLQQKNAVCVSTIDENGFPSGRFVDLKSVDEEGFVFCTYLDSQKGMHIQKNPKVAITVWWDHVGYQVRIVGHATVINEVEADEIWKTRKRSAQLTTTAFHQSQPMLELNELASRFETVENKFAGLEVPIPVNWGGCCVSPSTIEFLTFTESRLHIRELYSRIGDAWIKSYLQP